MGFIFFQDISTHERVRVPGRLAFVEAAFFDLDKTVIARASMVAFGPTFHREGLLSRWLVARAMYAHFVYSYFGADERRMAKMRNAALRVTTGWEQAHVSRIVRDALEEVIEPIVYEEAVELMHEHRAQGHKVIIVSASPEEIVAPLAQYLGADEAIATRSQLDADGCYTGDVEFYSYGPFKVDAMERIAARDGIDLSQSWAYSDSATDIPMLAAVGNPVAVNPDRELHRTANERGWPIRKFDRPVRLRPNVPRPSPAKTSIVLGGGVALAGLVAGVVTWVKSRR